MLANVVKAVTGGQVDRHRRIEVAIVHHVVIDSDVGQDGVGAGIEDDDGEEGRRAGAHRLGRRPLGDAQIGRQDPNEGIADVAVRRAAVGHAGRLERIEEAVFDVGAGACVAGALTGGQRAKASAVARWRSGVGNGHGLQRDGSGIGDADGEGGIAAGKELLHPRLLADQNERPGVDRSIIGPRPTPDHAPRRQHDDNNTKRDERTVTTTHVSDFLRVGSHPVNDGCRLSYTRSNFYLGVFTPVLQPHPLGG